MQQGEIHMTEGMDSRRLKFFGAVAESAQSTKAVVFGR
jgi:hypothetical protein